MTIEMNLLGLGVGQKKLMSNEDDGIESFLGMIHCSSSTKVLWDGKSLVCITARGR
jgi:hypothetical protein